VPVKENTPIILKANGGNGFPTWFDNTPIILKDNGGNVFPTWFDNELYED
jgi:hypothetical protein